MRPIVIQTSQPIEGNEISDSGTIIPFDIKAPETLALLSKLWLEAANWQKLMWQKYLGISSVQFPIDFHIIQETVLKAQPDIIIETGTAFGGTTLFLASCLFLVKKKGPVFSMDNKSPKETIEPRIKAKELAQEKWKIDLVYLEGSSTSKDVLDQLTPLIAPRKKVMVILDSNHDKDHVLKELELYSRFIQQNSYFIVCDTHCSIISDEFKKERLWSFAADPLSAVKDFLAKTDAFELDRELNSFPLSCFSGGILKRIKPRIIIETE